MVIGLAVVIVFGAIALFLHEGQVNRDRLVEQANIIDTFIYNGNTYTLSTAVENYFKQRVILRMAGNNEDYLILPGENGKWCAEIERFVYFPSDLKLECLMKCRPLK